MDLKDLYQEIIVDHNRAPRNYGQLSDATHKAEGYNPLCGDKLTVYLKLEDGIVSAVAFEGSGCAISVASASLMTEQLKGKTEAEAEQMFDQFHKLVAEQDQPVDMQALGKLAALAGVREYPARVKCATLCWHTLHSALEGEQIATTE